MMAPISPPLPSGSAPQGAVVTGAGGASASADGSAEAARRLEAAREFEAVLLQQMLKRLERTTRVGGGEAPAGQSEYGSMVVQAVADALARGGGLGIAELVSERMAATPPVKRALDGAGVLAPSMTARGQPENSPQLGYNHEISELSRSSGVLCSSVSSQIAQGSTGPAVPPDEIRTSAHGTKPGQADRRIR